MTTDSDPVYLRCVQLDADDLRVTSLAQAGAIARRALTLGANALCAPTGEIPTVLSDAAHSAGLQLIDVAGPGRPRSVLPTLGATWPEAPPGAGAALLARRHRMWPNALVWVRPAIHVPVPSNVIATVRRMAGQPGLGFSAPWPKLADDPAWAPVTVLPEPPPTRLRPGRGFAVNLWLCHDPGSGSGDAEISAIARWGDRVHSWSFAGPIPTAGVATVGTLPLVRPADRPLSLELRLTTDPNTGSTSSAAWRYLLAADAAGVPFWSPSSPDE